MGALSRLDTFIAKSRAVHGDKYDYSQTVYRSSAERVQIRCPEHGLFEQVAGDHYGGHGCKQCYYVRERTWSDSDDAFVRAYYVSKGAAYCANALGKSRAAIYSRAGILGAQRNVKRQEPYENIPNALWANLAKRSIETGRAVGITKADIWSLYLQQGMRCALTGWVISFSRKGVSTASVDRIDSDLGYLKDNIQIVHKDVNRAKVNYPEAYFYAMCKAISEHRKGEFKPITPHQLTEEWDTWNDTITVRSNHGALAVEAASLFDG